jgi:hypothetical protein
MRTQKGFTLLLAILAVVSLAAVGGAGYVAMNPQVFESIAAMQATTTSASVQTASGDRLEIDPEAGNGMTSGATSSISWKFSDAGEVDAIPYTNVLVTVNNAVHDMGKFAGSCSEVGANGGIDGKGLLAGELSAAQCWFAGGGDEIGVFAHEDGGFDLMVGELGEGDAEMPPFRGDFKIKTSIPL